jgi:PIN domain nuclease of toxin-antitoxin system
VRRLLDAYGDPFDRLLYAQALAAGCRLLSIDRALAGFGATVVQPRNVARKA